MWLCVVARAGADPAVDGPSEVVCSRDGEVVRIEPAPIQQAVEQLQALSTGGILVCAGGTAIRQVLHPQLARENATAPDCIMRYVDICRFDAAVLPEDAAEECLEIQRRIDSIGNDELVAAIEEVRLGVEAAVCSRDSPLPADVVVRARGLPWQASDAHLAHFFAGLNIAPGGIALCLSAEGRRNGEALIRFDTPQMRAMALTRHRHFLLSRYIEVYRASSEEFLQVAAGSSTEAVSFVSRGAAVIVRMRGLPYDATEQHIKDFFLSEPEAATIMDNGVLFVTRSDGRPTGDAFVLFHDEHEGTKALTKHRQTIGTRYIELFRSTHAEVQQVVKRSTEPAMQPQQQQQGGRRDCVRLRGLPYEARVEHVVEFLGDHARHIVFQGVHMVFNAQGHPSGECFIQMSSEQAASGAAGNSHNKFMTIGKKQRYIEVFQCSPEDMQLVTAAPAVAPPPVAPPMLPPMRFPVGLPPAGLPLPPFPLFWPQYPTPPVSPLSASTQFLVTGLGPSVSASDIAAHFTLSHPDSVVEHVSFLRLAAGGMPGEALVRLRPRDPTDPAPFDPAHPIVHQQAPVMYQTPVVRT